MEDANPAKILGAAGCVGAFAVVALLSLGAVPPLHYAIRYNSFNKYADIETVYPCGRHFIGPWSSFVIFPANIKTVEFTNDVAMNMLGDRYPSLHTRTKEGLALHLQVSLQYKLKKDKVGLLYKEFNTYYDQIYINTIRDTITTVAAEYESDQLWKDRKGVGQRMQSEVDTALRAIYAECWGLQLMVIELPAKFESSIVVTQVQEQNRTTMSFAQTAVQVRAETDVISAEYDRKVKVIKAHGLANYTLITQVAKAHARSRTLKTEAEVLETIKTTLNLAPQQMVEFQKYVAVQVSTNASMYYGFDDVKVLLPPGGSSDGSDAGGVSHGGGDRRLQGRHEHLSDLEAIATDRRMLLPSHSAEL